MRVMRILTRANLGGPTAQAIALFPAMAELGVRTLLVTGAVGRGESELSPAAAGVPRLRFDAALAAGEAASGWVELAELGRGVALLGDFVARRRLRRLLASFRPDVVHTHTSKAGWLGRRAAFAAGVPVVAHTFHGHVLQDYFAAPVAWALRAAERWLARRTDLLFAVSASCADELAAAGVAARERFAVVPPAVANRPTNDRAAARARLGIPVGERRVVAIGRLVPIKRLEHFLDAVGALPGVVGDVVGDGPQGPALRELARQRAPDRIVFRGALPGIAADLLAYDALVLPSVREGLPLVAVEAFHAGVPVLGYDVPGVHDALDQGRGVLVPVAAGPAGLAQAIAGLVADGQAAERAAAARQFAAACAPPAVARLLVAAYREHLSRRSGLP